MAKNFSKVIAGTRKSPKIIKKHWYYCILGSQKGSFPFKTLLQMKKKHTKKLLQDRPFVVKRRQKVQKTVIRPYET